MPRVTVTGLVSLQGTIVVLSGLDEQGREVTFASEPRMAQSILDALEEDGDDIVALVPSWAILGRV